MLTNKEIGKITNFKKSWIRKKTNDLKGLYPNLVIKGKNGRGCSDKISPILVPYFKKGISAKFEIDENTFKKIDWKYFVTIRTKEKIQDLDYLLRFLPKSLHCINLFSVHNQLDNLHIHFVTTSAESHTPLKCQFNIDFLEFKRGLGTFQYLTSLSLKRSNNQVLSRFGYSTNFYGELVINDF